MGRRRRTIKTIITDSALAFANFILAELEHEFLRMGQEQARRRPRSVAPPAPGAAHSSYRVLGVLPSAPREVVEAAYRALALKYHPDRRGPDANPTVMVNLNRAIETIRRERGWK